MNYIVNDLIDFCSTNDSRMLAWYKDKVNSYIKTYGMEYFKRIYKNNFSGALCKQIAPLIACEIYFIHLKNDIEARELFDKIPLKPNLISDSHSNKYLYDIMNTYNKEDGSPIMENYRYYQGFLRFCNNQYLGDTVKQSTKPFDFLTLFMRYNEYHYEYMKDILIMDILRYNFNISYELIIDTNEKIYVNQFIKNIFTVGAEATYYAFKFYFEKTKGRITIEDPTKYLNFKKYRYEYIEYFTQEGEMDYYTTFSTTKENISVDYIQNYITYIIQFKNTEKESYYMNYKESTSSLSDVPPEKSGWEKFYVRIKNHHYAAFYLFERIYDRDFLWCLIKNKDLKGFNISMNYIYISEEGIGVSPNKDLLLSNQNKLWYQNILSLTNYWIPFEYVDNYLYDKNTIGREYMSMDNLNKIPISLLIEKVNIYSRDCKYKNDIEIYHKDVQLHNIDESHVIQLYTKGIDWEYVLVKYHDSYDECLMSYFIKPSSPELEWTIKLHSIQNYNELDTLIFNYKICNHNLCDFNKTNDIDEYNTFFNNINNALTTISQTNGVVCVPFVGFFINSIYQNTNYQKKYENSHIDDKNKLIDGNIEGQKGYSYYSLFKTLLYHNEYLYMADSNNPNTTTLEYNREMLADMLNSYDLDKLIRAFNEDEYNKPNGVTGGDDESLNWGDEVPILVEFGLINYYII